MLKYQNEIQKGVSMKIIRNVGFTLIEVLVVVLIIGVLVAIALPQYQKAVLKSRFSSLMPTTKAVRDGNEAYYMAHGAYADVLENLDVTTTNNESMTLELSNDPEYAYVLSTRPDLNEGNNLIMYQKESANYPGEIHCEAEKDNKLANWLCEQGFHGLKIGEGITSGFITYVLEGSANGWPMWMAHIDCDKAEGLGLTCTIVQNSDGSTSKQVCARLGVSETRLCVMYVYSQVGGYTKVQCTVNEEGKCKMSAILTTYDVNGNEVRRLRCDKMAEDGTCSQYSTGWGNNWYYTYDSSGNQTSYRRCKSVNSEGGCDLYADGWDKTYDSNGNQLSYRKCNSYNEEGNCISGNGWDRTYDKNGKQLSYHSCSSYNVDGSCASGSGWDRTYDTDGNLISYRRCSSLKSDGSCDGYSSGADYEYDSNGNLTTERSCSNVGSDGSCNGYSRGSDYTYDGNGKLISQRDCSSVNDTGNCNGYNSGADYTYDSNGNPTSEKYCSSIKNDGSCNGYDETYTYSYDEQGRQTSYSECFGYNSSSNCTEGYTSNTTYDGNREKGAYCNTVNANGSCDAYDGGWEFTYDDHGKQTSYRECSSLNSDGSCNGYSSGADYVYDDQGRQTGYQWCSDYNSNGSCAGGNGWGRTYDESGHQTSHWTCNSYNSNGSCENYTDAWEATYDGDHLDTKKYCRNVNSNGGCDGYSKIEKYIYDEEGVRIATVSCGGPGTMTSDGECRDYWGASYNT